MIKWLKGIWVTSQEFEGDYHYHDNHLLPSDVDAEKATAEGSLSSDVSEFSKAYSRIWVESGHCQ
jgi:hypothetical protein